MRRKRLGPDIASHNQAFTIFANSNAMPYEAKPMFSNPVFSSPVLSKLDAAIIAVLLCSGMATLVESRHRVLIVAPAEAQAETTQASFSVTSGSFELGPNGEPMVTSTGATPFEPTFAARVNVSTE
jgi:hypothetical protein